MIIKCPICSTQYNVPDEKLQGIQRLKCSKCLNLFSTEQQESISLKDTAIIKQKKISDSLWSDDNLVLPSNKNLSLAVIKGSRAGYIYKIQKPYIVIGRGKVDLIIPDKEVSRNHLAVEIRDDKIILRDLGSTNGSYIGKKKISITEIQDQSEFRVGQTVIMLIATSKDDNF